MMHQLNATEIAVLRAVHGGRDRLGDIARAVGRSLPRTSGAVTGLLSKGFLEKERLGMARRVAFSGNGFISPFRELLRRGFRVEECLADSRISILSLVPGEGEGLRAADLVLKTGLSPATVRNFLPRAVRHAILKKTGEGYRFSSRMGVLRDFLDGYSGFVSGRTLRSISAGAVMRWRLGFEFLFSTPAGEVVRRGFPTSITAFGERGVQVRSDLDYYHYTPFKYKHGIEDAVVDCVLMDIGSVHNLTYSLMFLKKYRRKIAPARLDALCRTYGMPSLGREMLLFLEGGADMPPGFPARAEFDQKYALYGD